MGFNTTVIVMNDALDQIAKDPEFGKKLAEAIMRCPTRVHGGIDVSAGNYANAATVVETHHAGETALVTVGQNHANVIAFSFTQQDRGGPIEFLKKFVKDMGYVIYKKVKA